MNQYQAEISSRIKKIRVSKGFSQEYISYNLGISQATYNKIENNKISLKLNTFITLCKILEVSAFELIPENIRVDFLYIKASHEELKNEVIFLKQLVSDLSKQNKMLIKSRESRGEKIKQLKDEIRRLQLEAQS
ncbi:helix-turn-helix domain-containing protein [Olivibacter sp. CPCC 100613]|uniref:helix-turn-helix domain-containing protein n=1 Tax=Olivibacter sp. CPCC 100613 TaxID=3079931 RepID=UPI002FFC8AB8